MPADDILQLITILIILVLVMAAAFVVTRYIARFQTGGSGNNIEVMETYRLSPTKYVQIVRLGESYVAIAVCKDTVTLLKDIPRDELQLASPKAMTGKGFQNILGSLSKKDSTGLSDREEE